MLDKMRLFIRRRRAVIGLVITFTICLLTIVLTRSRLEETDDIIVGVAANYNYKSSQQCIIPVLQPETHDDIIKLPTVENCAELHQNNPVRIVNGSIIVAKTASIDGQHKAITCSYMPILFKTDFKFTIDKIQTAKLQTSPCTDENMFVTCTLDSDPAKIIFQSPIRCIFPKPDVLSRANYMDSTATNRPLFDEKLNIVLIGFDSMSHVTWLEEMPKTTSYLTEFGAVFFDGYNIIGDGKTAAILGLTSGYMEEELHEARRGFAGAKQIDDFPFIFYQLANEAGYATLWDEEDIEFGTFQYRLLGFSKPPVDHYGRTFRGFDEMTTSDYKHNKHHCYGSMGHLEEQLQLFDQLFQAYPDPFRKFALIYSSVYTHTSEKESLVGIGQFDDFIRKNVESWKRNGYFDNTVFVMFADHGSRYSGSRASQNKQRKISERLPLLSMLFPKWFSQKYHDKMANLMQASKQLTTPFDLHATLLDVAGLEAESNTPKRAISFFKPIPDNRDCLSAGIMPHWCSCLQNGDSLSIHDLLVKRCTTMFEEFVNDDLLARFIRAEQCLRLTVTDVLTAQRFVKTADSDSRRPQFANLASKTIGEYLQISFLTKPGSGQWEVTFVHDKNSGELTINFKQISRTNKYGSAPRCIQDSFPHLRPFCFCKH